MRFPAFSFQKFSGGTGPRTPLEMMDFSPSYGSSRPTTIYFSKNSSYLKPSRKPWTLRNYDGDGDGNVRKGNGFNKRNNNSARASRFFANFLTVTARLGREMTDQILSLLENGNGKVINGTISFLTRSPPFSSNLISVL